MKLLDRMMTLLRADAHGVMDQLEERGLLLKQHLRDAEQALGRERAELSTLSEALRRDREELALMRRDADALDEDVGLALARGEEELARFAIRKLLPLREALARLADRIERREAERERLTRRTTEQGAAFEALEQRVAAQLARMRAERAEGAEGIRGTGAPVREEEVELELLRRRGAGTNLEGAES